MTAYPTKVASVSHIVSGFTACHRIASPRPPRAPAKIMTCIEVMVPMTVGRPRVRAIAASIFCSTRQLNAAAAPATSAIPSVAKKMRPGAGKPGDASSIPMTAVNTISETTRGFVRRQNWAPRPGALCAVASWDMGACNYSFSAYLRGLQQPLQVLQHAPEIGLRGPAHHHIAARVHEADVRAVVRRAGRDRDSPRHHRHNEVLGRSERGGIGRAAVVHHEDAGDPRGVAPEREADLARDVKLRRA